MALRYMYCTFSLYIQSGVLRIYCVFSKAMVTLLKVKTDSYQPIVYTETLTHSACIAF